MVGRHHYWEAVSIIRNDDGSSSSLSATAEYEAGRDAAADALRPMLEGRTVLCPECRHTEDRHTDVIVAGAWLDHCADCAPVVADHLCHAITIELRERSAR
jgi:hypothetical protein